MSETLIAEANQPNEGDASQTSTETEAVVTADATIEGQQAMGELTVTIAANAGEEGKQQMMLHPKATNFLTR